MFLYNHMHVFIDLSCFLTWAMWPMGLLFSFCFVFVFVLFLNKQRFIPVLVSFPGQTHRIIFIPYFLLSLFPISNAELSFVHHTLLCVGLWSRLKFYHSSPTLNSDILKVQPITEVNGWCSVPRPKFYFWIDPVCFE